MNDRQLIQEAAVRYAHVFDLPVRLIMAICEAESSMSVFAFRYEPHYRWLWNVAKREGYKAPVAEHPEKDFPYLNRINSQQSEWTGQKCSWGPMQVMGAVAREHGFQGRFPELCTADVGVLYGAKHLALLHHRFYDEHGVSGVVSAYNQGGPYRDASRQYKNQIYVDRVMKLFRGDNK